MNSELFSADTVHFSAVPFDKAERNDVFPLMGTEFKIRRYGTVDFVTSGHSPAEPVPYCRNFILPC